MYPKALQDTFSGCGVAASECGTVAFDICKCFLSVLLHNKYDFPLYTIHNEVEPFDNKLKTGEYKVHRRSPTDEVPDQEQGANHNRSEFLWPELNRPSPKDRDEGLR